MFNIRHSVLKLCVEFYQCNTKLTSSTTCNELQGGRQLTHLNAFLIVVNDIETRYDDDISRFSGTV